MFGEWYGSSTVIEILLFPSQTDYCRNLFHYRLPFSLCLLFFSIPASNVFHSRLPQEVPYSQRKHSGWIWCSSSFRRSLHRLFLLFFFSQPDPLPSHFPQSANASSSHFAPSLLLHSDPLVEAQRHTSGHEQGPMSHTRSLSFLLHIPLTMQKIFLSIKAWWLNPLIFKIWNSV